MHKTFHDFPNFYNHPFIQSIANNKRWTVCDNNKRPIDMFSYMYQQKITGAIFTDEKSLVSLPELCDIIPDAANNTYYMDTLIDNFVVLDIEKTCPDNIKQKLLSTPYIYGEVSLSGKGYHLIFPLPECFSKYPIAQKKIVMKEQHGYYEILLQHYVTFTRNMLPPSPNTTSFETIFEELASIQTETVRKDIDIQTLQPANIPFYNDILAVLSHMDYKKTPEDFCNDMSKYEYGFIGFFYRKLKNIISIKKYKVHNYTDNERAWILYTLTKDKIRYRPKHDEFRNNLPWLLYLSGEIIAKDNSNKKEL